MLKIGDRFKDKTTGKIYIIKTEIDNGTLFLEGENGLGRRLTGRKFETNVQEVGRHNILRQISISRSPPPDYHSILNNKGRALPLSLMISVSVNLEIGLQGRFVRCIASIW